MRCVSAFLTRVFSDWETQACICTFRKSLILYSMGAVPTGLPADFVSADFGRIPAGVDPERPCRAPRMMLIMLRARRFSPAGCAASWRAEPPTPAQIPASIAPLSPKPVAPNPPWIPCLKPALSSDRLCRTSFHKWEWEPERVPHPWPSCGQAASLLVAHGEGRRRAEKHACVTLRGCGKK